MPKAKGKRGNPAWRKGAPSPNPSGRPTLTENQRAAREAKAAASPEAVALLRRAMEEAPEWKDRISAAKALIDDLDARQVDAHLTVEGRVSVLDTLSTDTVVRYLEAVTLERETHGQVQTQLPASIPSLATVDADEG